MAEKLAISSHPETTSAAANETILNARENVYDQNLQSRRIQRKLSIGAVDDPLEDEADAVADKVMRIPEQNFIQRKCAHCEEEEKAQRKPLVSFIQKKEAGNNNFASDAISSQIHSTRSSGSPLSGTTKSFMESRFGNDFSNVHIHTDNHAAQISKELNAQAFTVGNDIYFNEGKYQPESSIGKHLLAHELTHTIQQGNNSSSIINRQPGNGQPQPQTQPQSQIHSQQQAAAPEPNLQTRVRSWLEQEHFSLPIVADRDSVSAGRRRVLYGGQMSTLDNVTNDVTAILAQTTPGISRPDIWMQVWQYYNQKKIEAEQDRWQTVVQVMYTPQYTFASTGGPPAWQQGVQLSGGRNYRLHRAGSSGLELTFQGNLSLFNLSTQHANTGDDAFQSLLASAQLQYVWNLGNEFRFPTGQWANVQASLFTQAAAGLGANYADISRDDRRLFVGFLVQPSAGGQINLNIGWFQIIVQGSVVYSYLSPTTQSGSQSQHSGAINIGAGLGAQF